MEMIGDLFTGLWEVWKEMWGAFIEFAPRVISFLLWTITGFFILPCVFIAGNIYPKWVDWGEKTF